MKFIDLNIQQQRIRKSIETRIQKVLDHGQYIMGPEISELEVELGAYVGVKHAVGCASGTDALLLALLAYGVKSGDAVFTTPFSFIATAEAIALVGATPVFVDIDPSTFNLDPERLEAAIAVFTSSQPADRAALPKTANGARLTAKGVIAVDLFGLAADYRAIRAVADRYGLFVIEDAAQSFGASYHGRKTGGLADIGCTSFFPAKPLGCYGDGGMCFTDNDELAAAMRSLLLHGQGAHRYDHVRVGINGRLDTLQAAVLLAKLEIFAEEIELRQQVAETYSELLAVKSSPVVTPRIPADYVSAWAQYSVLAGDEGSRAALRKRLEEAGVPTAVYYPKPLHLQPAFSYLGYAPGGFPVSEDFARRIFSLPIHPYLRRSEQEAIAKVLLGG